RHERPIEEKESQKWLNSHAAVSALRAEHCPETVVVSVGDREADLYELFMAATEQGDGAHVLVRAERTRRMVQDHGKLWEFMQSQPVAGIQYLGVPRRGKQAARTARMEVRFAPLTLQPPRRKRELPSVGPLWAVWTREVGTPEGVKPLEWMLLSDMAVTDLAQACERLAWYAQRWQIEVYHRTLKSGCRIEERQLGQADRLEGCLAIDMVVAWRIFHLAKLGREVPEVPCTVFFEDAQWKALHARVRQSIPAQPPSLREAIRLVAGLGGFLGRKSDGEPGTQTLWRGLQRLDDITEMYLFFSGQTGPPAESAAQH
ncbi:MAG: IS4 family transposase, partial [Gammaproteobacteria bacterium]